MSGRGTAALVAFLVGTASALAQGAPFVDARSSVPDLVLDMRYADSRNFVGRPIAGYEAARCLLTPPAAQALRVAQDELRRQGFGLKVFDCYRPVRAVADFVAWADDPADQRRKAEFYPDIDKRDLFRLGYIAKASAHSRGSTVDLTLVRLADRAEIDMGSPFDFFGPVSAPGSGAVSTAQAANRAGLRAAMIRAGFKPYAQEWWHFSLQAEPYPSTVFDLPVR